MTEGSRCLHTQSPACQPHLINSRKTNSEIGGKQQCLRLISHFRQIWDAEMIKRIGIPERLEFASQADLDLKNVESIKQSVSPTTRWFIKTETERFCKYWHNIHGLAAAFQYLVAELSAKNRVAVIKQITLKGGQREIRSMKGKLWRKRTNDVLQCRWLLSSNGQFINLRQYFQSGHRYSHRVNSVTTCVSALLLSSSLLNLCFSSLLLPHWCYESVWLQNSNAIPISDPTNMVPPLAKVLGTCTFII